MMITPLVDRVCLYQSSQLESIVDEMAWRVAGLLTGKNKVLIVGIIRRGAPLAEMLHHKLAIHFRLNNIRLMHLEIKRYADDLTLLHPETRLTETPQMANLNLTDTTVLVVDDVMHHGHSMLRAVEYLASKQAAEIRTAVLVDRGLNKLPVRIDITGVRLDVAPSNVIECNIPPYEKTFRIDLFQPVLN